MTPRDVIGFWTAQPDEKLFSVDPVFDAELADRFGALHAQAAAGELQDWRQTRDGRLALVLLLDQMSRNLDRGTPAMFANDAAALTLAEQAIAHGDDKQLPAHEAKWLYLPFMHSEQLEDQQRCVELSRASGFEDILPHAIEHRDIIARFGRFPHRNKVLGRETTRQEQQFLDDGGFGG